MESINRSMKWELNKIFVDEIFFILSYNEVEIYLPVVIFVKFDVNVLGNLLPSDFILINIFLHYYIYLNLTNYIMS